MSFCSKESPGFTLGYQWSEEDLGTSANEQQYDNEGYGITFAINDDLSIGYNNYESKQTSTTNVTADASIILIDAPPYEYESCIESASAVTLVVLVCFDS